MAFGISCIAEPLTLSEYFFKVSIIIWTQITITLIKLKIAVQSSRRQLSSTGLLQRIGGHEALSVLKSSAILSRDRFLPIGSSRVSNCYILPPLSIMCLVIKVTWVFGLSLQGLAVNVAAWVVSNYIVLYYMWLYTLPHTCNYHILMHYNVVD